jgi:hypothetical protein
MKKLVLSLAISLVSVLNVFSQNSSDNEIIYNTFKDKRIDSILNSVTPTYKNHSKLKKQTINLLYEKKFNVILDAIKCKGFQGFYNINDYEIESLIPNTTPDSIFINKLKNFTNNLPKNKSMIKTTFTDVNGIKDKTFFEEYEFIIDNTTYFLRVVYINSQMNGMLLDIHSKY